MGRSHHAVILFDFSVDVEAENSTGGPQYRYNFHKANYPEMRRISSDRMGGALRNKDEEMYRIPVQILCDLTEKYVPRLDVRAGSCKPKWMTGELRTQISAKDRAWRHLKARKTPRGVEEYRRIRNITTSMVNRAKKAFIKKLLGYKAKPKILLELCEKQNSHKGGFKSQEQQRQGDSKRFRSC